MGTEISRPVAQGIIIPDRRITYANLDTGSDYTQAGVAPDVAEPDQAGGFLLRGAGEMPSDADIKLHAVQGGPPGLDGARLAWRKSTDGTTRYRGCDEPHVIVGYQPIHTRVAGTVLRNNTHTAVLSDGTIVTVYDRTTVSENRVSCYRRNADEQWAISGGPAEVTIYDHGDTTTYDMQPCLLVLPNDVLACLHWKEYPGGTVGSNSNILLHISEDKGATWDLSAIDILPSALKHSLYDLSLTRLRAAYQNGQVLLTVYLRNITGTGPTYKDAIWQYASTTMASSMDLIESPDPDDDYNGGYQDLVVFGGRFHMAYIGHDPAVSTDTVLYIRSIGSAYDPLSSATAYTPAGGLQDTYVTVDTGGPPTYRRFDTDGDLCLVAHHNRLWLYVKEVVSTGQHRCYRSDDGEIWRYPIPSDSVSTSWAMFLGSTSAYLKQFSAVSQRSRVLMVAVSEGTGSFGESLLALPLGGMSQVTMPRNTQYRAARDQQQSPWQQHWMPLDTPDNMGWTLSATGGSSTLQTDGSMLIATSGSEIRAYTYAWTPNIDRGVVVLLDVAPTQNGTNLSPRIGATMLLGDGTHKYQIRVNLQAGDGAGTFPVVTITDAFTPAITDSYAGDLTDTRIQILLGFVGSSSGADGKVYAFVREVDANGDAEDRQWSGNVNIEPTDNGSGGTVQLVWGHCSGAGGLSVQSNWYAVRYAHGEEYIEAPHLSEGQLNPDALYALAIGPESRDILGGLKASGALGTVYAGHTFTIPRRWDYALENLLASDEPNMGRVWRSTTDADDVTIAYQLNPGVSEDSPIGKVLGIALQSINWPVAYLESQAAGSGSWNGIITLDARGDLKNLNFLRSGTSVRPDTSAAGSRWYRRNELAGGVFKDDSGNLRRILGNSSGVWRYGDDSKQLELYLGDVTGSEDASGTDAEVWAPRVLGYRHYSGINGGALNKIRLRIPSTTTLDGYFQAKVLIGEVTAFGWLVSDGALARRTTFNEEITEYRNGSRTVVKMGERARSVSMAFTAPIPQHPLTGEVVDPEWFSNLSSSGYPWGVRYETPGLVEGLAEELEGAQGLCAVLPVVYRKGEITYVSTGINDFIIARRIGPIELTTQLIREDCEAISVATIRFEEEPTG